MDVSIAVAIIGLLSAPFAAAAAWAANKKKVKADNQATIAAGAIDAVEAIKAVMSALHHELAETKVELLEFKRQNKELEHSLEALRDQNELLLQQNTQLTYEVAELKKQMDRFSSHG